ncbi:spore coat protein [Ferroacidibacillus organovorans]|nr:spore coat protein [Ferroacidibacillus organovorans]
MNRGMMSFGAHELIGLNEALMAKSANIELLSFLSQHVQDQRLRNMLEQHAESVHHHYMQGVQLLQGQGQEVYAKPGFAESNMEYYGQPKLGLRNPNMPMPRLNAQAPSERTICTTALSLYKFGAIGWTTFGLECTNPQLREWFMRGTAMSDKMAYEMWGFMNQKGYYQVITLPNETIQAMMHAYTPSQMSLNQGVNAMPYQ